MGPRFLYVEQSYQGKRNDNGAWKRRQLLSRVYIRTHTHTHTREHVHGRKSDIKRDGMKRPSNAERCAIFFSFTFILTLYSARFSLLYFCAFCFFFFPLFALLVRRSCPLCVPLSLSLPMYSIPGRYCTRYIFTILVCRTETFCRGRAFTSAALWRHFGTTWTRHVTNDRAGESTRIKRQ